MKTYYNLGKKGFTIKTGGNGLWSIEEKKVKLTNMFVDGVYGDFGELRVYFDLKTWDPDEDGLIYTDDLWLKQFREKLITIGYTEKAVKDIDYSEQGMQGDDYVSLDCGIKFMGEYFTLMAKKKSR